jgi:tetratricopeptide (TPR) repeat protein
VAEFDLAIADLDKAIALDPKTAPLFVIRALARHGKGAYEVAIADFDTALTLDPRLGLAREGRDRAKARLAALPTAAEEFDACLHGAVDDRIAACSRVLGRDPKPEAKTPALFTRAKAYVERGAHDRAIADVDEAIRLLPGFGPSYNLRGSAWLAKGDLDRAVADFEAAIKLSPKDADGYMNRGIVRSRKADYGGAVTDFDQAIAINAAVPALHGLRGDAHLSNGEHALAVADYDRAISGYDEAIERDPSDPTAFANRGIARHQKGEDDLALADLDQAVGLNPKLAAARSSRGDVHSAQGAYDRAVADLDQAIRLDPRDETAFAARGEALSARGELGRALADFEHAIRLNPAFAVAFADRGLAFARKGNFGRAVADLERALALNPRDAASYADRSAVADLQGDRDGAVRDLQVALRLNPGLAKRAEVRKLAAALAVTPGDVGGSAQNIEVPAAPPPGEARSVRRVALVIGNAAYQNVSALKNPQRDAELVAAALQQAGFETQTASDLGRDGMVKALREFRAKADKADWAAVYFAGHGLAAGGVSYLIPVDARLGDERDLGTETVSYDDMLRAMEGAGTVRLLVLDACRDNPFAAAIRRTASSRGVLARGLAPPPEQEPGTLILYAAKDGEPALDGEGDNSPFARAFANRIKVPGHGLLQVLAEVRDDVLAATGKRQHPYSYGSWPAQALIVVPSQ